MSSEWRDLPLRAVTAAIGVLLAVVIVLFAPSWVFAGVVGLVAGAAAWEFLRLTRSSPIGFGTWLVVLLTSLLPLAGLAWGSAKLVQLVLVLTAGFTIATALWFLGGALRGRRELRGSVVGLPGFAVLYCGGLLTAMVLLREEVRAEWVLLVLAVSWGSDIGGYLMGRSHGKTPLAPAVSPRKTWEGVWGGVLTALVLAVVIKVTLLRLQPHVLLLALALGGSILAQSGDLFESAIKRAAGVSNSGSIVPGQGGVLDAIDGLAFAAPLIFVGATYFAR